MDRRNPTRIVRQVVLGVAVVRALVSATLLRLDDPDRPSPIDDSADDFVADEVPAASDGGHVVRAVARETRTPIRRSGVLRAAEEVEVRTRLLAAGDRLVMERIGLDRGSAVRAGDVIARLIAPHIDMHAAEQARMMYVYEAELATAHRDARRADDPIAADLAIKKALSLFEGSRAALRASERAMAGLAVCSPIDGVVAELPPIEADSWEPVVVARIVRIDPLVLEVGIPLGDTTPLPGTRCDVFVGGVRRQAVARGMAPRTDARGSAVLMLDVGNTDRALPAGLRVDVVIDVGARQGVFVPSSAVQQDGDEYSVRVVAPNRLERRGVDIISGGFDDPEVEVSGLRPGEFVAREVIENPGGPIW